MCLMICLTIRLRHAEEAFLDFSFSFPYNAASKSSADFPHSFRQFETILPTGPRR